jgi:H+/Cl- antiporter ClcA
MIKRLYVTLLFILFALALCIAIVASYFYWLFTGKGMVKVFDWISNQIKKINNEPST